MSPVAPNPIDTGLEVLDLESETAFTSRQLHHRDTALQLEGLRRLSQAFLESPGTVLQELVNAAVQLCGADSAGISIEQEDAPDAEFYQWVATAGDYARFLHAKLPRYPSACGMCLERGRPQLFRVTQRFFDLMGVEAPIVTDGILLPWKVENTRGTLWIMAHTRSEAFDSDDLRVMKLLSDFAAMAVRQQAQQRTLTEQTSASAAAAMANYLAHEINNPLQSLANTIYLAARQTSGEDAKSLAEALAEPLQRLSVLVQELLALPGARLRRSRPPTE